MDKDQDIFEPIGGCGPNGCSFGAPDEEDEDDDDTEEEIGGCGPNGCSF